MHAPRPRHARATQSQVISTARATPAPVACSLQRVGLWGRRCGPCTSWASPHGGPHGDPHMRVQVARHCAIWLRCALLCCVEPGWVGLAGLGLVRISSVQPVKTQLAPHQTGPMEVHHQTNQDQSRPDQGGTGNARATPAPCLRHARAPQAKGNTTCAKKMHVGIQSDWVGSGRIDSIVQ
eukprot:gene8032-biopygen19607